jgi:hypothetical protein
MLCLCLPGPSNGLATAFSSRAERSAVLLRCTVRRGNWNRARWGAPSSIAGLRRDAWRSLAPRATPRPEPRCCKWLRCGRASPTRPNRSAMNRLRVRLVERRFSRTLLLGFHRQPRPDLGHLLQNCLVLFVLGPPCKTATFLGEFSVVRWGFHAGTIPGRDVPFRNKFQWQPMELFRAAGFPPQSFCIAGRNLSGLCPEVRRPGALALR